MSDKRVTACLAGVLIAALTAIAAAEPSSQPAGAAPAKLGKNPQLVNLEPNKWFKLHEQKPTDEPQFNRMAKFAACFDSRRSRIVLMGDIHNKKGELPSNSPFFFDLATETWSRAYPDDTYENYTAIEQPNGQGIFAAGEKGDRPWGGSIFHCSLVYDPDRDELVLCSQTRQYNDNLDELTAKDTVVVDPTRGKAVYTFKGVKVSQPRYFANQPVWAMNLQRKQWTMLGARHPDQHGDFLFPAVYDSARKRIVAYSQKVFEIGGDRDKVETPEAKVKVDRPGPRDCGTAAYDAKNQAFVGYGIYGGSDAVTVYYTAGKEPARTMPTPGQRPPKAGRNPCAMAFDAETGKTVLCVPENYKWGQESMTVGTWLYDLAADAWKRVPGADLPNVSPDGWGYTLMYDPNDKVCLLVGRAPRGALTVWALKIAESRLAPATNER
jgi:hypothetical protein